MPVDIHDDDDLFRRLAPVHVQGNRVTSAAFKFDSKPDPEVSVHLARLTSFEALGVQWPERGLGRIVARDPRSLGLDVLHDPLPSDPSHSLIRGNSSRENCKRLAEMTDIVVPVPGTQS